MARINNLFSEIINRNETALTTKSESYALENSNVSLDSATASLPAGPQEEFLLQQYIRPLYGKTGINSHPIGTHPDFLELENNDGSGIFHYTCTMFIDIKGSTRLNLLYSPEEVHKFKNSVLQVCIETVRAHDGHVHRLMGDAVLAFFGGKATEKEDSVADAINCAMTLRTLVDHSIKPWMDENGFESDQFGIRVGVDFGDDEHVLWAGYGYGTVGEVTATGLSVDMASKLQGKAGKNQLMLGQGLLDFVDWPSEYSETKTKKRDGSAVSQPIVTPNLTNKDGTGLNYRMRLLSHESYLKLSPLPTDVRARVCGNDVKDHPAFNLTCIANENGSEFNYISTSKFLNKNVGLTFRLQVMVNGSRLNTPLTATFSVLNYGKEADDKKDTEERRTTYTLYKKRRSGYGGGYEPYIVKEHSETTLYRGLHTMECSVRDASGVVLYRNWVGVLIK